MSEKCPRCNESHHPITVSYKTKSKRNERTGERRDVAVLNDMDRLQLKATYTCTQCGKQWKSTFYRDGGRR